MTDIRPQTASSSFSASSSVSASSSSTVAASDRLAPGEHTAHVHGVSLRYRVAGQGPILIMQSPGWGIGCIPYVKSLAPLERSHTVVYYDPRASGASTHTPPATLHVGTLVEDLEGLRAYLGIERFRLAGHSHGGLIAAHYALRHPERVSALVLLAAQLVGVRPHPAERNGQVDPAAVPEIAAAFDYLESVGGFERMFSATTDVEATGFLSGIAPLYFRDPRYTPVLREMFSDRPIPVATMQSVSATDGGFPLSDRALRACPVPTLVVSGRYDMFCPPAPARQLAETMPHARYAVFEQSGHFAWIEEPEAFFETVSAFLTGPSVIPAR